MWVLIVVIWLTVTLDVFKSKFWFRTCMFNNRLTVTLDVFKY